MGDVLVPLINSELVAVVDSIDAEVVSSHRWRLHPEGYAETKVGNRSLYMHRLVMGVDWGDKRDVHHCDDDKLNNRRSNLEVLDRAVHVGSYRTTSRSGYKGVFPNHKRWMSKIAIDGRQVYLGTFDTPEEAARAYDSAAAERYGRHARLNFPELD